MVTSVALAVASIFIGCHSNVVSLEFLTQSEAGRSFNYALTFFQFLTVGLLSLPYLLVIRRSTAYVDPLLSGQTGTTQSNTLPTKMQGSLADQSGATWYCQLSSIRSLTPFTICCRPLQVPLYFHLIIACSYWAISVLNNYALAYGISIPVHAVFRSSTLITNIIYGVCFFESRYSVHQLLCATVIFTGLVAFTLAPYLQEDSKIAAENVEVLTGPPATDWLFGLFLLVFSSLLSPVLALSQERAIREVKSRKSQQISKPPAVDPAPLWAELSCLSSLMSLPFFAVALPTLLSETVGLPFDHYPILGTNLATQYVCATGAYKLNELAGAFTMVLATTVRKFFSLIFSVFYFGHAGQLSIVELAAMLSVGVAAMAYPFLPKVDAMKVEASSPKKKIE
eukprot:GILI01019535.1.p1 GENE.GILI01019535.1~~GILI01019535.1.p1  ORF type:complete len:396 (+),score=25.39 GILI01019535.1:68-1255(+)